jgi:abortive infection bacteriophage resistance protein
MYVFDRHLRLLMMDAIERIEVSLRSSWCHYMAMRYGPHGYLNPGHYSRADHFARALTSLMEEVERSKDTFIVHYNNKYGDPKLPPSWMVAEVMSLGQLSKWIGNLKLRADRKAIFQLYGLDEAVLVSVAHHLTYVRNICAHHSRLWNKQFIVTMTMPNRPAQLQQAMNPQSSRKLYNTLAVTAHLLDIIAPGTGWRTRLIELIDQYPRIDLAAMGFPADWRDRQAWQI